MSLSEQFAGREYPWGKDVGKEVLPPYDAAEGSSKALQAALGAAATPVPAPPQKPLAPASAAPSARVCEGWASVAPAGPADGWHIPWRPGEHPPLERIAVALERIAAAMEARR